MNSLLFEAFNEFCNCENYFQITEKYKFWGKRIFGHSEIKIMFVHGDKIVEYVSDEESKEFSHENGIMG